MMDFLKQFPFVSREEYLWEWTVPQVRLATLDNTHVVYLNDKQAKNMKSKHIDGTNLNLDKGLLHL